LILKPHSLAYSFLVLRFLECVVIAYFVDSASRSASKLLYITMPYATIGQQKEKTRFSECQSKNLELLKLRKRSTSKPNFNEILLASIDEALSSLGEDVAAATYFNIEKTFNIKRREIPQRINDFSDALENFFGVGARCLELLVMKNLHAKVGITCKWLEYKWPLSKWIVPEVTFREYVNRMRENYENASRNKPEMGVLMNEYEELQK